jgi:Carboxypeptidase regulatory-like domain
MSMATRRRRVCISVAVACVLVARGSPAQEIRGRVLDEFTDLPIAGALVLLLDAENEVVARETSGDDGAFHLQAPASSYRLQILASGYAAGGTPSFPLRVGDVLPLDLLLEPRPVSLPGLEVSATRYQRDLRRLGVSPDQLGARVITRAAIDQRQSARDVGDILAWESIPGVRVVRGENLTTMNGVRPGGVSPQRTLSLCVTVPRATRFDGYKECAVLVLDGRVTTEESISLIDPAEIEMIVVLTPVEATQLFGTGATGGAVAIYTRRGRER